MFNKDQPKVELYEGYGLVHKITFKRKYGIKAIVDINIISPISY
jgi:hypothetical protein